MQNLNLGSVQTSEVGKFNSKVTVTGDVGQTAVGQGHKQSMNLGGVR